MSNKKYKKINYSIFAILIKNKYNVFVVVNNFYFLYLLLWLNIAKTAIN